MSWLFYSGFVAHSHGQLAVTGARDGIVAAVLIGFRWWLFLVLLVASIQLQVRRVEEPYLLRTHGDAYRAYAAQVGRFIPGVGMIR